MHVEAEVALEEWAVICAALCAGRQRVLLREGGADLHVLRSVVDAAEHACQALHLHELLGEETGA